MNGVSKPGNYVKGGGDGEYRMTTTKELDIKNTGELNQGHVSTGYPEFLGAFDAKTGRPSKLAQASKTLPIHLEGIGKKDLNYSGPNQRIEVQRYDQDGQLDHISQYDLSENPKKATILTSRDKKRPQN